MAAVTEVELPFRAQFRAALLNGTKTATTRTTRHGVRGDTFLAFGARFVIVNVERMRLWWVAEAYWGYEGVSSPQAFIDVWGRIHPRRGYRPNDWVFVHEFQRVRP